MKQIEHIGVVGAGAMGRGILQLFASAGQTVHCYDAADGAADEAIEFVRGMITRLVEKERLSDSEADAIIARIHKVDSLDGLADCDLVIEAIVEDLSVKQTVFADIEAVVASEAIIASNTSSLLVSAIAAECRHPERVAGMHFFNPVPLMKVVEIISAVRTDAAVVDTLVALTESAGHRAVIAADQPGFLVNHAGRGYYTEAFRCLEDQVCAVPDIDRIMRLAGGFRMGPLELLDLTGLDISGKAMVTIYNDFQQEPRFRPSSLVPPRVAAGLYGRKTGEGWHRYENGRKQEPPEPKTPDMPADCRFWVAEEAPERRALLELVSNAGAEVARDAATADVIIVQPWGEDVSSVCASRGYDARRTVAVDPLPGLDRHRTLMLSILTDVAVRDAAHALLAPGPGVTVISDSPGFVVQRVLAMIVNIATNIAQRGIASVQDIEDAVRLGLGYPAGPLTLGEQIGPARVLAILENMQATTGDPRYRPSLWLRRRVALGASLLTEDAARG
ncbi:MAG: 3-hydroxyacyl-CoA dehydrogenase [Salinisphaeraceae bacterium]|nr:3-hydroxyacyl-CoA dehydrogenase [Salinisphaeraceae bacterium]